MKLQPSKTLKSTFTVVINQGDLAVHTVQKKQLNRVVSTERTPEGQLKTTLLCVPGDIWRFSSREAVNVGPNFKLDIHETIERFVAIAPNGMVVSATASMLADVHDNEFTRANLSKTLYGEIYGLFIKHTLQQRAVGTNTSRHFSISDLSALDNSNVGNSCISYLITHSLETEAYGNSLDVVAIPRDEAELILSGEPLPIGKVLIRQSVEVSNNILVNTSPVEVSSTVYIQSRLNRVREEFPALTVKLEKKRFRLGIDLESYLANAE